MVSHEIHCLWVIVPRPCKAERGIWKCRASVRYSVSPRYVVSALRFLFVDQLISNLHTIIILGISSLSSKLGKENLYLEDFRPEECDGDKCDLKMAAIAAIMVAILAAIFNMVAKTPKKFRSAPMLQLQRKLTFRGF